MSKFLLVFLIVPMLITGVMVAVLSQILFGRWEYGLAVVILMILYYSFIYRKFHERRW